jgi:sec-independent protein translocase protein TatB
VTFGINGAELIILILLAVLVLGPEKLPEYTRKLTEWIRNLRRMAEGAKVQFKDETGTDFDEIDWRRYDPRQYDPRRIIREALAEPVDDPEPGRQGSGMGTGSTAARTPSDTREALRKDLDAVRTERDALREDLKDMDPRALFFGSSSARRTSSSPTGAGSSASGTRDAAEIAGPTPAGTDTLPSAPSAETQETADQETAAQVTAAPGPAAANRAEAHRADADRAGTDPTSTAEVSRPAPFDAEAT